MLRRASLLLFFLVRPAHADGVMLDRLVAKVDGHKVLRSDLTPRTRAALDRKIDELLVADECSRSKILRCDLTQLAFYRLQPALNNGDDATRAKFELELGAEKVRVLALLHERARIEIRW